jgi:isoleucyl-tRNA synthetase
VPDVLDTWFDSGSMPFATKRPIPADFIGEAQDQTRAWFYYLHVLAGALFDKPAFLNCNTTGIVLAEDGKKMAKKLKNYPDPVGLIEKYGADAMRFYILSSPVVQAENLAFSEKGVAEIANKNIGRLYNVLAFYQLYQDGTVASDKSENLLDVWIISKLNGLVKDITEAYENYRLDLATRPLTDFIDELSVWYLRRSRDRFKEDTQDKADALATLRFVFKNLALVMAPSMPFFADYLFMAVCEDSDKESVHLASWPVIDEKKINPGLIAKMQEARDVVNLALAQRQSAGIKVKQPLATLKTKNKILDELLYLIKDEINVKEVVFNDNIEKEVELDTNITEELREEGQVREVIRSVQEERKNAGLKPQDKIFVELLCDENLASVVQKNKDAICKEVHAKDIGIKKSPAQKILLKIEKV